MISVGHVIIEVIIMRYALFSCWFFHWSRFLIRAVKIAISDVMSSVQMTFSHVAVMMRGDMTYALLTNVGTHLMAKPVMIVPVVTIVPITPSFVVIPVTNAIIIMRQIEGI